MYMSPQIISAIHVNVYQLETLGFIELKHKAERRENEKGRTREKGTQETCHFNYVRKLALRQPSMSYEIGQGPELVLAFD